MEHDRRGADESSYGITGPEQRRPPNCQQALSSTSFKREFVRFLSVDWRNHHHARTLENHEVYLTIEDTCFKYTAVDGQVMCEEAKDYKCNHEEADTRIIYHLNKSQELGCHPDTRYSARANDSDIYFNLLYHSSHMPTTPNVWMDAGLSGKNTCLLYTSPSPRDLSTSRMPSSA